MPFHVSQCVVLCSVVVYYWLCWNMNGSLNKHFNLSFLTWLCLIKQEVFFFLRNNNLFLLLPSLSLSPPQSLSVWHHQLKRECVMESLLFLARSLSLSLFSPLHSSDSRAPAGFMTWHNLTQTIAEMDFWPKLSLFHFNFWCSKWSWNQFHVSQQIKAVLACLCTCCISEKDRRKKRTRWIRRNHSNCLHNYYPLSCFYLNLLLDR